jgi:hypothetical protein
VKQGLDKLDQRMSVLYVCRSIRKGISWFRWGAILFISSTRHASKIGSKVEANFVLSVGITLGKKTQIINSLLFSENNKDFLKSKNSRRFLNHQTFVMNVNGLIEGNMANVEQVFRSPKYKSI